MTLLKMDTFERYANGAALANGGWTVAAGTPTIDTSAPLDGTQSLSLNANERIVHTFASAQSHIHIAYRMKFTGSFVPTTWMRTGNTGAGDANLQITITTGLFPRIMNAVSSQIAISPNALVVDTEYLIEWRIRHASSISAGDVVLWVDGDEWINVAAGTNTAFSGGTTVTSFSLMSSLASGEMVIDDLAVWNLSGSGVWSAPLPEDYEYFGGIILPDGNGESSDFTGSDGNSVDNFQQADEALVDGDTTHNESATLGDRDLYSLANMPVGDPIAVQTTHVARKTTADAVTYQPIIRSGTTVYNVGTEVAPATTYGWSTNILEQDPDTADVWTEEGVNDLQIGAENTTDPEISTVRLTQAAVEVFYTEALPDPQSPGITSALASASIIAPGISASSSGSGIGPGTRLRNLPPWVRRIRLSGS